MLHPMVGLSMRPRLGQRVSQRVSFDDGPTSMESSRSIARRSMLSTYAPSLASMHSTAQELKDKMNALTHRDGDETVFISPVRAGTYRFVTSKLYEGAMALLTLGSIYLLVVEADAIAEGDTISSWQRLCGRCQLALFSLDMGLRLYVFRLSLFTSISDLMEMLLVVADFIFEFSNLPNALTVLKVVRFLRLGRALRTVTQLRELYLMCQGLVSSIRAILFGTSMVLIAVTMFSILAVYLVRPVARRLGEEGAWHDCLRCEHAFDTVLASNLTFMSSIIAGDSWGKVSLPLIQASTPAGLVVLGCFFVLQLGLLNTIAGAIVDKQVQAREEDEDFMLLLQSEDLTQSLGKIADLFRTLDNDDNNQLTLSELEATYDTHSQFRSILNRIDIHRPHLGIVFDMIDRDGSGSIDFDEFVAGLHKLQFEDAHTMAVFTKHFVEELWTKWPQVEALQSTVEKQAQSLKSLKDMVRMEDLRRVMERQTREVSNLITRDFGNSLEALREVLGVKSRQTSADDDEADGLTGLPTSVLKMRSSGRGREAALATVSSSARKPSSKRSSALPPCSDSEGADNDGDEEEQSLAGNAKPEVNGKPEDSTEIKPSASEADDAALQGGPVAGGTEDRSSRSSSEGGAAVGNDAGTGQEGLPLATPKLRRIATRPSRSCRR
eukprot:TRINITY_DN15660_c0_g2_i4.p1 TRINITY_DN15660_c0_g2~~TRINITY_DN15660_c0_g2_i4.p1  ORF type:complete len:665 (-),score=95.19 TRINITY_DN15660_c0_g2_i4:237-2231(-)